MHSLTEAIRLQAASYASQSGQARHALVAAVDPPNHAVRVTIQPEGVTSGWIPDPGIACAGLSIACPAEVGTQVLVIPVEGDVEHPVIVARLFDTTNTVPNSPLTGAPVQPGEIGVFLSDGTYLHVTAGRIGMKAALSVDGSITCTGDVVASHVSLAGHRHAGIQAGPSTTTAPIPS